MNKSLRCPFCGHRELKKKGLFRRKIICMNFKCKKYGSVVIAQNIARSISPYLSDRG